MLVVTYQLAYRTEITVDLCRDRAGDYRYPLGPVSYGAHRGECDECRRLAQLAHEEEMRTGRYYLMIRTGPHQSWTHPQHWAWGDLDAATAGAREADGLWMEVRLMDAETGKRVDWRGGTR